MSAETVLEVLGILRSGGFRIPVTLMPSAPVEDRRQFALTWAEALESFDDRVLVDAARRWLRTMSQFPTLAEFIELARIVAIDHAPKRPALRENSGDGMRMLPPAEQLARLAELKEQIAATEGPLFKKDGETVDPIREGAR